MKSVDKNEDLHEKNVFILSKIIKPFVKKNSILSEMLNFSSQRKPKRVTNHSLHNLAKSAPSSFRRRTL